MMYSRCMNKDGTYINDEQIRAEILKRKKRKRLMHRLIAAGIALILTVCGAHSLGELRGTQAYAKYNKEPVHIISDVPIVKAAEKGIGNMGGEPFWSWYGFGNRVDWCACFVSWAAGECGALDAGNAPKFAYVPEGSNWFINRDLWKESSATPEAGDLIFFDWDQDGARDHVGIVSSVVGDRLFTIEGNSSDRCRVKCYNIGDEVIYGYGSVSE